MNQKSLIDVCVISKDPFFINRLKIFSQFTNITFEFSNNSCCKSKSQLFLVDISQLYTFLNEIPNSNNIKFIVSGNQKDLASSFNAGCTDFLKDPWDNDELEARILKALENYNLQIEWGKLILSQKTISSDNFATDISIEEYIILKKLLENKSEPVPREALLYALWGNHIKNSRAVDMHISRLRKKIEILKKHDNSCCSSIKTIRSYGYMII